MKADGDFFSAFSPQLKLMDPDGRELAVAESHFEKMEKVATIRDLPLEQTGTYLVFSRSTPLLHPRTGLYEVSFSIARP
jgi:hypothetical protein